MSHLTDVLNLKCLKYKNYPGAYSPSDRRDPSCREYVDNLASRRQCYNPSKMFSFQDGRKRHENEGRETGKCKGL